ncbi:MAG: hypothetical protein E6176_09930 [Clostridium celatum]|nr:hypothetical protein [Clostridium celatum]
MSNKDDYNLVLENDKTVKQLFDRFYIVRKNDERLTEGDRTIIEKYMCYLVDETVIQGKNGYLVYRGKKTKLLTIEQQQEIKESTLTQGELAEIYKVSPSTISKVKNNKY